MARKVSADPFVQVRSATLAHRSKHGCGSWPYGNGALLGTLAAAVDARRILELGTALGYTALSFAHGAAKAHVDTVERDPEHVRLARSHIAAAGMARRVTVHEGDFAAVLPTLEGGYDLAVTCSDLVVPHNVRGGRLVLVQEGMTDPERFWYWVRKILPFMPLWSCGTSGTGLSGLSISQLRERDREGCQHDRAGEREAEGQPE